MDIRTAIRTNGAVRSFTDEVVADATIFDILDDARFAPSGGNRQGWRVAIVKDASLRAELAALMTGVGRVHGALAVRTNAVHSGRPR
jgi:nitroreductase